AERPVGLAEAKLHLKLDTTDEDVLVDALIDAATEACRRFTGRELVSQTWRLMLDAAPDGGAIELPRPPLIAVTHVKTYDDADAATTFAAGNYFVDTASVPGRVVPRTGATWPTVGRAANGLEVEFVAGFGAQASAVPAPLRQGILVLVAYGYERREAQAEEPATLPAAVRALWQPFRVARLAR
ncbi:MAG: head-tail connector protein, partial [Alphaproteobacteria bacterium]